MTRIVDAPRQVEWLTQDGREHTTRPPGSTAAFHRRLPGYRPTPLLRATELANALDLDEVWVKDESNRLDLPSFKVLGASWATYTALRQQGGFSDDDWDDVAELAQLVHDKTGVTRLAAATDGNHGRAVAHVAAWLGLAAAIFVPRDTSTARIEAIQGEGATVEVVDGGYEDAVRRSAQEASADCLVISDTSWEGYESVPSAVVEGYSTIFDEAEAQLAEVGARGPNAVVVQVGVGALAGAAVRHYRGRKSDARLVCVEPLSAACNLMSMQHGERVSIPGPHASIMVGLNCDTPSLIAWPDVSRGFDAFLAVDDDAARMAMRHLAGLGIVSGETGAAGLAGLTEICHGSATQLRDELGLGPHSRVLLISTEGATDPEAYASIVGAPTEATPDQAGKDN